MDWSPQQNEALTLVSAWLRMRYKPWYYLAGYAGTGKTTLAQHLSSEVRGEVIYAAYTGKAASVMRSKGCTGARTLHSLLYAVDYDPVTKTRTFHPVPSLGDDIGLIVVDEVSMADDEISEHLLSHKIPVLVLGDPAQLPPVKGAGYFTRREPDYLLTEVHRQALESPILRLATMLRERTFRPRNIDLPGLMVCQKKTLDRDLVTSADMILVGRNATRQAYNKRMRELWGRKGSFPEEGEPLICLNNDQKLGIFNGQTFDVTSSRQDSRVIRLKVKNDETAVDVKVFPDFFVDDVEASKMGDRALRGTQQFAYAYAITCHKAQGSQWNKVCVFNESEIFREDSWRWEYTAVTRAAEHLTLVY